MGNVDLRDSGVSLVDDLQGMTCSWHWDFDFVDSLFFFSLLLSQHDCHPPILSSVHSALRSLLGELTYACGFWSFLPDGRVPSHTFLHFRLFFLLLLVKNHGWELRSGAPEIRVDLDLSLNTVSSTYLIFVVGTYSRANCLCHDAMN